MHRRFRLLVSDTLYLIDPTRVAKSPYGFALFATAETSTEFASKKAAANPQGARVDRVVCYDAVTPLTELFCQNETQSEIRPDRRARSVSGC
jgi:hypothetical protein